MNQRHPIVILLAEDDPADQELTRRAFELGRIDNELYIVNNGEEALDYLYRRNAFTDPKKAPFPDVLLLDLNMPKIGGKEVMETIQQDPAFQNLRTIVLTTSNQEQDIVESYRLGVSSYITKPVDPDQFFRAVATLKEYWFQIVKLPPKER